MQVTVLLSLNYKTQKNAETEKPQPGGNFGDSPGGLASVP